MVRLVLFDVDGTLVHTGGAGVKAFARTFASEFKVADGFERLKFAGRTDIGLVREFFGFHHIEATPENLKRFFEHSAYVHPVKSYGGAGKLDEAWRTLVEEEGNEGLVVRSSGGRVYKVKPRFSYDLVVCDEVQDLTDIQVSLLFRLAANPRAVVLTGDASIRRRPMQPWLVGEAPNTESARQ
jgi:phosphoglycolate phosphatase-like HAD superfamily hydrolase